VTTIGIVGLGLLGHAVASRLLAARHVVMGYDVVAERRAALAALGGKELTSVQAVAASAEAICVVLPTLESVEQVVLGPEGLVPSARSGQVVIQMSTISPTLTERLAEAARRRDVTFLDCPISGTSGQVLRGDGIVMVGGERAAFEQWRSLLEAVLPRAFYVGPAGQAMLLKLVANLLIALHSAAAAEALTMARRAGLDVERALEILVASAATSRMLEVRGPGIVRGEFPPQMKLDNFMKDLHLIQEAARSADAPLPLTDVAEHLYATAQRAGHGGDDLSVVVRVIDALKAR
jgi:3-hydroxyisobutyrate dehydrogenase-like beta-hydroxyacid dehydrogenase